MIKHSIRVSNKLGLHARAATKLVHAASGYECEILICREDQQVDAKSIMGIMMLAAPEGTELEIILDGSDEKLALESIVNLFKERFGEEE